jgi:nucleotide-binding universal stress UspA family protein
MISTSAGGETQVNDVSYEAVEGDARSVICEAVDRHHADMLVVGCHGYSKWKRSSSPT